MPARSESVLDATAECRQRTGGNWARRTAVRGAIAVVLGAAMDWLEPCMAQTSVPRERTLRRSIEADKEVRIAGYTRMEQGCIPGEPPRVVMLHQPSHGTVSIRPGPSTINEVREGTGTSCAGMTVPGTHVWFIPAPGYRGNDQFDWNVVSRGGVFHDTAMVEVK